MRDEAYTIRKHRHLYACWCAARAYGRGLKKGSAETAFTLIEASGLKEVSSPDDIGEDVDAWLLHLMNQIMGKAALMKLEDFSFGRAQKLVSIYLKTVLVCGGHHEHPLVAKLPPPLDRQLFKGIRKHLREDMGNPGAKAFRSAQAVNPSWTSFSIDDYLAHVAALKLIMCGKPLYMVEEHWLI
jgi:hypothetical protein